MALQPLYGPGKNDAIEVIKDAIVVLRQCADYSNAMRLEGRGMHLCSPHYSIEKLISVMSEIVRRDAAKGGAR